MSLHSKDPLYGSKTGVSDFRNLPSDHTTSVEFSPSLTHSRHTSLEPLTALRIPGSARGIQNLDIETVLAAPCRELAMFGS